MLAVDGVMKRRGGRTVLRDVRFAVRPGEVVALLGSNGAGKSTMVSIVAGLLPADAGRVSLHRNGERRDRRTTLGIATQEIALYPTLTCAEHLRFFARLHGLRGTRLRSRVADVVERMQLGPYRDTRAHALSGGWQRRLHLAVSLVHEPQLVLLDEPTVGLDVETRAVVWRQIRSGCNRGAAVLLATNVIEEAEALSDRVIVLADGSVAADGTLEELRGLVPAAELAVVSCDDQEALRHRAELLGVELREYAGQSTLLLRERGSVDALARQLSTVGLRSLALQPVSLTHAYLEVLRSHAGRARGASRPV
jgi:ABC-2 type transport system ATP-binding protein